jgi:hypothetical protein
MSMTEQLFYGYFEDPRPGAPPEYDPPHDAPCPFCGKAVSPDDVRTHSLMFDSRTYAHRSYFYRTHKSCAEHNKTLPERDRFNSDDFIFCMIARNGD